MQDPGVSLVLFLRTLSIKLPTAVFLPGFLCLAVILQYVLLLMIHDELPLKCDHFKLQRIKRPSCLHISLLKLLSVLRSAAVGRQRRRSYGGLLSLLAPCLKIPDCFCGLAVRAPGYRFRGPGIDYRRYQIFLRSA
jgi:hypothetical protein